MKSCYRLISIFLLICLPFQCTNYSSKRLNTVPPILISITKISIGHKITIRAGNPEVLFIGYKLYKGTTSNEARNAADLTSGQDCEGGLKLPPNQPLEYVAIVGQELEKLDGNDVTGQNVVCYYRISLQSNEYIAMRSVLLSIQLINTSNAISVSAPSNALIVP
ncbi:MAG: hypothetical protein H7A23_14335 [Leptospiraceae bacterium]|nr:hypothetical protein [Leptospiraceae bacterium]MCP5495729.1 hypothetical protein [Leptospiraceae bacterium]